MTPSSHMSPSPLSSAPSPLASHRAELAKRFTAVRNRTLALALPLSQEDQCVQSMPDTSPTKWHLAHTSWFFETVVLQAFQTAYCVFDPQYLYLFNSYYEALGPRHPRPQRGLLTRPSLAEVHVYREYIDTAMQCFFETTESANWQEASGLIELGLQHEEQHQELLLTDILHLFSCNPLLPPYLPPASAKDHGLAVVQDLQPPQWLAVQGGIHSIGHAGDSFAFDNETPRHQVLLRPFLVAHRLTTCGEYLDFMADGGYARPEWWLSDGWAAVKSQNMSAPSYWLAPGDPRAPADHWQVFGLHGVQALNRQAPVTHVSFYEAAAFAQWADARLPTEFEWEAAFDAPAITQMQGHGWQWTRSAYDPYPGFRPHIGAVREYNGKFMIGQQVLRGASEATPVGHSRKTYRNFFPASARWQFSTIRLAKDST